MYRVHVEENILPILQRRDHSVFARLLKKYTFLPSTTTNGRGVGINYNPMSILLDGGLLDTAMEYCLSIAANTLQQDIPGISYKNIDYLWSNHTLEKSDFTELVTRCMLTNSPYTEPTLHNPEVCPYNICNHYIFIYVYMNVIIIIIYIYNIVACE